LSELVTHNFLEMRGRVRQTITATTVLGYEKDADPISQIILPFNKLVTDRLDSTSKMIVPYAISYSLGEGRQRIQGWYKNVSADANIGGTTEAEEDATRGPLPSQGNFEKPSGQDLADFTFEEATTGGGGGTVVSGGGKVGDLFPMFIRRL